MQDLAAEPETRDLEITKSRSLRAYAGVPVRLRSGELYGTLCTVDTRPHPELTETQVELLHFVSELTAELIDAAADDEAARMAEASATGVRTLLVALEARDFYTGEHSKQVVGLASAVARRLGLGEQEIRDVEQVALLHDVGKVGIPDAILQKQGPLNEQEWELMRQHPVVGERIIVGTPGLSHLAPAMRAEHERWDGAGYPDGLAGEEIPLASRITLACDAFHAMTSDRPYRPAMSLERACEELRSCAGTQFDPRVAEALLAELGSGNVTARRLDLLHAAGGEESHGVAPGGMRAEALDQCGGVVGENIGLGEGNAVAGWSDRGCRERRERQVGRAEPLAAEVRAAVGQQARDEVELALDDCLVLDLDAGGDVELAASPAHGHRPADSDGAVLPGRHTLVVEPQHQIGLGEHVDVNEAPRPRPERFIEAATKLLRLGPLRRSGRQQAKLLRNLGIDPVEDLRRLAERPVRGDEDRDRPGAPGAARGELVNALNVALLPVGDSRAVERPPRLLAVMADRDGDEPQHRARICRPARPG